ncbi:hypothetical protein LTR85_010633 [Meristemomyces frigidus]|nr:hypothetical protein LTR85_010633 [Meristemomyces frigidus]
MAAIPMGPTYQLLLDVFNQEDLDNWIIPNWLDIKGLNDTPACLTEALHYAASTAHDLAESFEMKFGRKPQTWNAIISWATLLPVHVRSQSADMVLTVQTFSILIADATLDVYAMRVLWAREEAKLSVEGELDEEKRGLPLLKAAQPVAKSNTKATARPKPRKRKAESTPEPTAEDQLDEKEALIAGGAAPMGAATQFMERFCVQHGIYALAEHSPTWSEIAFVAGCRFERRRDISRTAQAVPDLLSALSTAASSASALANMSTIGIIDGTDQAYTSAQLYGQKWGLVGGQNGYDVPLADWQRMGLKLHDAPALSRLLCIAVAEACRDLLELRARVLAKRELWQNDSVTSSWLTPIGASVPSVIEQLGKHATAQEAVKGDKPKTEADGEIKVEAGGQVKAEAESEVQADEHPG